MNIYLAWTITVLYWIVWPIYWILSLLILAILYLLRPLYVILCFLAQPFVYLGLFIGSCIAWPFLLLARLETLYIYLGVAGLVGIGFGLGLHFFYGFLHSTFHLGHDVQVRGPTAKEHRAAWRQKQAAKVALDPLMTASPIRADDSSPRGRRGLMSQTIHEEIDSDY